jgi:hypothetical protein
MLNGMINDSMIMNDELIIVERKEAWPTTRYYSSIFLEGTWKFTETAAKSANFIADTQIQCLPSTSRNVSCYVILSEVMSQKWKHQSAVQDGSYPETVYKWYHIIIMFFQSVKYNFRLWDGIILFQDPELHITEHVTKISLWGASLVTWVTRESND